jgi:signal transduction histidine kinase
MLDHARRPSTFELVALSDIIERVREVAQPRLARSHIRLEISVAKDLPRVRADATQLEMAFLNLVTNALDAMPGGGALSLVARPSLDGISVEVADTGPGIPADLIDRLFESWVTTKPAGQGTGLGLAIVRDVVRAHGGTVSASNEPTGARFVIDFPAAPSQASAS